MTNINDLKEEYELLFQREVRKQLFVTLLNHDA